jgi:photosystem II stability/assembly factor-like uncharacterized protein
MLKFFKLTLLILLFFISKEGYCQFGPPPGWFSQQSSVTSILVSVNFTDNNTGYAVGYNGVILKTTNGGSNWNQQTSGTSNNLKQCSFVSENVGFIIDAGSLILNTTNGGSNWNQQISGTTNSLTSISIVNDSIGYICGLNRTLLKSTNGGNNWNSLSFLDSLNFHSIFFINSSTGWISAEDPTIIFGDSALIIFKTTNGGGNWFQQFSSQREYTPFQQIQFTDSLNGWMVLQAYAIDFSFIYKTNDGGNSWTYYPLGPNGGYSIYFINKRNGWAAGIQNRIYNTNDGGITWNRPNLLPSFSYTSIFFSDSLNGWTFGDNGVILKTTSGGVLTNFTNSSTEIPDKYFLSQNYPNPFNPTTNLEFGIAKLGFVSLKVYDVLGNEVKTLVNENKTSGNYKIEFSSNNLPSGIYFYSLIMNGNIIDTKRMILLK